MERSATAPRGATTFIWNEFRRKSRQVDAKGHLTRLCQGTSATNCTLSGAGAHALQLQWDALDRINTVTRTGTGTGAVAESYTYDDSGRRIKKTSAGNTTQYLYDSDAIHAEWNGSMAGAPSAAYTHGAGIDSPILRLTGSTNSPAATQLAYLQDGLGSVVGTMNTTGTLTANQRFDAWGNKTGSSGTVATFGYTGREPDATGLTHYRARYYHPGIGRFISRDPAGMVDAVSPYAYVGNSPVGYVDPYGWEAMDPAQGGFLNSVQSYWGKAVDATAQSLSDFGSGFVSFNPLGDDASLSSELGRGTRVAVDYGLIAFDVANSMVSPTPDAGIIGAAGITGRAVAKEAAERAAREAAEAATKQGNFVYRGLAKGEDAAAGLSARTPGAGNSPISHVAGKRETQWISTTKDLNTALEKYGQNGVVRIDLNKVGSEVLDVSRGFPQGGRMSNWARRDQEVLIRDFISPDAIVRIK